VDVHQGPQHDSNLRSHCSERRRP